MTYMYMTYGAGPFFTFFRQHGTKIRIASMGMAQDIFEVSRGGKYKNESAFLETSSFRCHQKQKRRICFFVASTANIDLLRSI